MTIFDVANHDFSVYEGKTELEIINILKDLNSSLPIKMISDIANILVDLKMLKFNPFSGIASDASDLVNVQPIRLSRLSRKSKIYLNKLFSRKL